MSTDGKPLELMPWQQELLDWIGQALEEGRTEPRYVQGRRGGYWTFVAPDTSEGGPS